MIATTGLRGLHRHLTFIRTMPWLFGTLTRPGAHACGDDDTSRLASQSRTRTAHEAMFERRLAAPQLVAERENEIEPWDRYLQRLNVGRVSGWTPALQFFKSLDAQKRVFSHVLQRCAEAGGKIITTHSIRSATAVLDLVEAHLPPERGDCSPLVYGTARRKER